jgi:hypothetical protein
VSELGDRATWVLRALLIWALGLTPLVTLPGRVEAGPAMVGTLTDYLPGGKYNGSTIGDYTVAATGFLPLNSGITDDKITVTPVSIGLQFTLPGLNGAINQKNLEISWMISDTGGAASIKSASLAMTDTTVTGTGLATITDQLGLMTSLGAGTNTPEDVKSLSPTSSVTFDSRLLAQIGGGPMGGQATIRTYTELINVPEPSASVLALIGALGVAILAGYDRRPRPPRQTGRHASGLFQR